VWRKKVGNETERCRMGGRWWVVVGAPVQSRRVAERSRGMRLRSGVTKADLERVPWERLQLLPYQQAGAIQFNGVGNNTFPREGMSERVGDKVSCGKTRELPPTR